MSDQMLTVSDAAREKILALLEAEDQKDLALRIEITGRGSGGFRYDLQFVGESEKEEGDAVLDGGGFKVLVEA